MSLFIRPNRTIIKFFGKDAKKLLNSCLSVNFEEDEAPRFWALLSPQGKIMAEGLGIFFDDAFWLDIHKNIAENFIKRMMLYRLRDDVTIENMQQSHKIAYSKTASNSGISFKDPKSENLGFQTIAPIAKIKNWQIGDEYEILRINNAIAELGEDYQSEKYSPHDIGLDLLGAIDFSKGCYIGQEVVARMQHKAEIKRRPLILSNINANNFAPITLNDKKIGYIGKIINKKAIGFIRLDKIDKNSIIKINNHPVQFALPNWANYQI